MGADLAGAVFEAVRFPAALRGASLKESVLNGCDLGGCDASSADLHLAMLYRCKLAQARFDGGKLIAASFVECVADGASFARIEAPIAAWVKTSLRGASFAGAGLERLGGRGRSAHFTERPGFPRAQATHCTDAVDRAA